MQEKHISSALNDFLDDYYFKIEHPNMIRGLPSGLTLLDNAIDGFGPGEVILIGARPAMGKTSFAVNIAHNIAKYFYEQNENNPSNDKCVLYFNLGMNNRLLAERFVSLQSGLSHYEIQKKADNALIQEAVNSSSFELSKLPLFISNQSNDIEEIDEEIKKIAPQKEVGCVIIDYLQLIGVPKFPDKDYTKLVNQIKQLAIQFNVPFIVLTQLSRDLERRVCKIPLLSDIRGYNKNQKAADKIIFLYREIYYIRFEEPKKRSSETGKNYEKRLNEWKERCRECTNQCDIIVAKNPAGPCTIKKVTFLSDNGLFKNLDDLSYI